MNYIMLDGGTGGVCGGSGGVWERVCVCVVEGVGDGFHGRRECVVHISNRISFLITLQIRILKKVSSTG